MSSLRSLLPRTLSTLSRSRNLSLLPSLPSNQYQYQNQNQNQNLSHFSTTARSLQSPQDPYPLPLSNPDLAALASRSPRVSGNENQLLPGGEEEWPMPAPLDRTGESLDTIRARLVYQTRKRGTLETDLILATFARDFLGEMDIDEMREFDKLLDEPDWDIYYWSVQKKEPPPRWANTPLLKKLQQHARNEGREVRMMPALSQRVPTESK